MNNLFQSLGNLDPAVWARIISSLGLLLILSAVRWGGLRVIRAQIEEQESRYRWGKALTYVVTIAALFLLIWIWFSGFSQVGAFLGLLTAALAIALRELVTNLAGWIFIIWRRPFRIGDRIEIDGHRGDVVDIRLFQFSLLEIGNWVGGDQWTGRIIHIPNGKVFGDPVANYASEFPFVWHELPVMITFESNWQHAKQLLEAIVAKHGVAAKDAHQFRTDIPRYAIDRLAGDPVVITSVADSGVVLTMRFLVNPRQRRSVSERVWEETLTAFGEREDIDLAYPTTRIYSNPVEGKPGARADLPPRT